MTSGFGVLRGEELLWLSGVAAGSKSGAGSGVIAAVLGSAVVFGDGYSRRWVLGMRAALVSSSRGGLAH